MPNAATPRRRRILLGIVLVTSLALPPGCIFGSPVAAFSGEPYGMTRDDVSAMGGKRGPIWGGRPVLAAIDLPFAAILDTGFLPIALIFWGLSALVGGGDEHDHGHGGGRGYSHDDEEEEHTHDDGSEHSHGDGSEPHTH
jgi:uncharacterized protein YceK